MTKPRLLDPQLDLALKYNFVSMVNDIMGNKKTGKFKTIDNDIIYSENGNFHNLDGPALITSKENSYYYIDGVEFIKEDWEKHPKVIEHRIKKIMEKQ